MFELNVYDGCARISFMVLLRRADRGQDLGDCID